MQAGIEISDQNISSHFLLSLHPTLSSPHLSLLSLSLSLSISIMAPNLLKLSIHLPPHLHLSYRKVHMSATSFLRSCNILLSKFAFRSVLTATYVPTLRMKMKRKSKVTGMSIVREIKRVPTILNDVSV